MAHHKSAIKKIRQDIVRTNRNKSYRTRARNAIKEVRHALHEGQIEAAQDAYRKMVPIIDSMVSSHHLHKNAAARTKSRLNHQIKLLVESPEKE
ncbi:30S ribosomal protein S20 [bacterium]|nr:30S ribosomal protein S20 [candidate division CSSED10-310 bacterium]